MKKISTVFLSLFFCYVSFFTADASAITLNLDSTPEVVLEEGTSAPQEDSAVVSEKAWKTFAPRFFATFDWGREASMPCWPETKSTDYGMGGEPVNGYGFGVGGDFRPMRELAFMFDIAFHSWKYQVAEKGSRSTSFWVFEQTDYSSYYTGTFDRDVFFYMDATIMRLGIKYFFPVNEKVEPWVALAYGMAAWNANFYTKDKSKTYGGDSGNGFGASYMVGVDFRSSFTFTVFLEGGSPVAKPIEVDNLFYDGWTWRSTAGEHAILPYRVGIAISM